MADEVTTIMQQTILAGSSLNTSGTRGNVWLLAHDNNVNGTRRVDVQSILAKASSFLRTVTATAHGLVSGDIGKPLSGTVLLDDANVLHYPSGLLDSIPDSNTLTLAIQTAEVVLPLALLENGGSFDVNANGRFLFWDLSAVLFRASPPADSVMPSILEYVTKDASNFTARIRCF